MEHVTPKPGTDVVDTGCDEFPEARSGPQGQGGGVHFPGRANRGPRSTAGRGCLIHAGGGRAPALHIDQVAPGPSGEEAVKYQDPSVQGWLDPTPGGLGGPL